MPRALVFDVFGTLVDWRGSIARQLDAFGTERGIACDWKAFVNAWRMEYVPSMERVRTGARPFTILDEMQAESLDRLIVTFALPDLSAADRAWIVKRWHALDPWPEVRAAFERLHAAFPLATLSNGNVSLLVDLARHAGLRFDAIFSAEIFGHYKPDPQTYLGAARLFGCAPEDVMLVAAHESDLRAAAGCGLRTAFVERPSEYGPAPASPRPLPIGFDYAVRDLDELANAIASAGGRE